MYECLVPEEYQVWMIAVTNNQHYFLFLLDYVSRSGLPQQQKTHDYTVINKEYITMDVIFYTYINILSMSLPLHPSTLPSYVESHFRSLIPVALWLVSIFRWPVWQIRPYIFASLENYPSGDLSADVPTCIKCCFHQKDDHGTQPASGESLVLSSCRLCRRGSFSVLEGRHFVGATDLSSVMPFLVHREQWFEQLWLCLYWHSPFQASNYETESVPNPPVSSCHF